MKAILLAILFSIGAVMAGNAQGSRSTAPQYTDRYTLDLPGLWKDKTRLLAVLNDVLPVFIDTLRGKKFCKDCDAGYTVKLSISDMQELERHYVKIGTVGKYRADINFVFRGSLLVTDAQQKPILNFALIDTLERQKTNRPFNVPVKRVNSQYVNDQFETKKTTKDPAVYALNDKAVEEVGTPQEIFDKLPPPTPFEMYGILEKKIQAIHAQMKKQGKL